MRRYETISILDPDLTGDGRTPILERINDIIAEKGGALIDHDEWGNKRLAYAIKKKQRGFYVRTDYCGDGEAVSEIERFFRIDDRILKFMTVLLADQADPDAIKTERAEAEAEAAAAKEAAAAAAAEAAAAAAAAAEAAAAETAATEAAAPADTPEAAAPAETPEAAAPAETPEAAAPAETPEAAAPAETPEADAPAETPEAAAPAADETSADAESAAPTDDSPKEA